MANSLADDHDVARLYGSDRGLGRLARFLLAHRKAVGLWWLAVAVVGIALVGPIAGRLTSSTAFPGLPSYQAGLAIEHTYGNGGSNSPIVAVVTLPVGQRVDTPAGAAKVTAAFAALDADHSVRVLAYPAVSDPRLVSEDGRAALGLVFAGNDPPTASQLAARMRATAPPGVTVAATGLNDLYNASGAGGNGALDELALGAAGALVVLVLIFGSFLAVIPLIIAAVAILGTFLVLGAITTVTHVSQLVEYLVALVGLGVAIDYSLLVVTRWRTERDRGRDNDEAVVVAMATAGRAVAFSGATVAASLLTLILLPIPFLRSLGYGGLLIPLVTVIAAVTLLPVLLSAWGPRLDRRTRRARRRQLRRGGRPSRAWAGWTRVVVRHRILAVAAALVVLGVLLGFAFGLRAGEATPASLDRAGSAEQGLTALQHAGFPVSVLSPIEILVPGATNPTTLATYLAEIPGVETAVAPTGSAWRRHGTAMVDVLPAAPTSTATDEATVAAVRTSVAKLAPGAEVAGDGPEEADIVHAYYSRFPLIVAIVALISLLALARAFRSIVLPLKAVVLNLISVGAAYGALVLIWQKGYGSHALWGIPATGVVVDFVPMLVFAFLFGLSMDYEVFILSAIKEARDAGMSTDEAVVDGLGHTGRLVTSAAIILFLAFAALASGANVPLKVFATGVGVGILLDATVVRALLVPALVSLLGRRQLVAPVPTGQPHAQHHLWAIKRSRDRRSRQTSYTYDPFGELTSETNGNGATVSYAYDKDGDTTGISYPISTSATWPSTDTVAYAYAYAYAYDNAHEMSSVTDFNSHAVSVTNNADGLPTSLTLGSSGDTISTTYDPTDSPSAINLKQGSTTLLGFSYTDTPSGGIAGETDTPSSSIEPARQPESCDRDDARRLDGAELRVRRLGQSHHPPNECDRRL